MALSKILNRNTTFKIIRVKMATKNKLKSLKEQNKQLKRKLVFLENTKLIKRLNASLSKIRLGKLYSRKEAGF